MNVIQDKHDYYAFPFIPLLFVLVGFGMNQLWKSPKTKAVVIVLIILVPVSRMNTGAINDNHSDGTENTQYAN